MNNSTHPSIVLYGAGSHAYVLEELARLHGYRLAAVLNDWDAPASFRIDAPVVTGTAAIEEWLKTAQDISSLSYAISIGNHYGRERVERHHLLRSKGVLPAPMLHPTAFVSRDATLGEACQVLAFGHIGVRSHLGDAVIINTRASIDHECILGNGVHIAPGATVAGRVTIGDNTMLGTGASIGPDITVAANCIIGAGSVVVRDIVEPGVYVGAPARLIRENQAVKN